MIKKTMNLFVWWARIKELRLTVVEMKKSISRMVDDNLDLSRENESLEKSVVLFENKFMSVRRDNKNLRSKNKVYKKQFSGMQAKIDKQRLRLGDKSNG